MRYSRTMGGEMYYPSTAVLVCEVLKFLVSLILLMKEESGTLVYVFKHKVLADVCDFARLSVPAGLYTVQNNLAYFAMSHLDAATYQLLYQLKILTTALFSVLLLGRALSVKQWLSLCVLCLGVGLVQTSSASSSPAGGSGSPNNSVLGLAAVVAACCSSGLAGVYFEMVLKNAKTSLWIRNIQLSLFGILLGVLPVVRDWPDIQAQGHGFFHGYNSVVWGVVLLQAGGGLLVAMVVKYADNILKGFATSLSILISCVASYFFFNFVVTARFATGAGLVLYAVWVYGSSPAPPQKAQAAPCSKGASAKETCGDH